MYNFPNNKTTKPVFKCRTASIINIFLFFVRLFSPFSQFFQQYLHNNPAAFI